MTKIYTGDSNVGVCKLLHNSRTAESKLRCQPNNIYAYCATLTDGKSNNIYDTYELRSLLIEAL
jgi:hypothetical protein